MKKILFYLLIPVIALTSAVLILLVANFANNKKIILCHPEDPKCQSGSTYNQTAEFNRVTIGFNQESPLATQYPEGQKINATNNLLQKLAPSQNNRPYELKIETNYLARVEKTGIWTV